MKPFPVHAACLSGNKNALKKIIVSVSRRVLEIKDSLGRTPLILAAIHNHIECGALLLKAGVHVDNSDNACQTALHFAASKGFHAFVKLLLSYKASSIQGDYYGVTALHLAAIHPNPKTLSVFLKHLKPGEIDIQDSTLKTPLHWSAAYAYDDNIKLLLAQGANICIPDEDGKTPLHYASSISDPEALECVKTLLKTEVNLMNWQDYQGRSALHSAVATGSVEILYFLASREDCNIDVFDNAFCTPLHLAAKKGFSEKADILLRKRANHSSADDNGATPLHYAAYKNHAEIVEVFISRQYISDEADRLGRNALIWASIRNSEAALKVIALNSSTLLNYADKNGVTALHAAAVQGHTSIIKLLVSLGVPVDIIDKKGMTPFLNSCAVGRSKAAQLLLDLGADIHAHDINKCSALHWCGRGGHAYLCQTLLKRGAKCNVQDSLRMTPLHCSSIFGDYINCISVLLESGANPNIVDFEGKSPLHFAILNGRKGIVRLLCEYDADVNAMFVIDDWVTPLDCALLWQKHEIIHLLKRYGGLHVKDIRDVAAKSIQVWFIEKMKGRERKKKAQLDSLKGHKLCHSSPSLNIDYKLANDFNKGIFPSKVPLHLRNSNIAYYECKRCFHKILCQQCSKDLKKCYADSVTFNAAIIIQRFWRRYMMKKKFLKMRLEAFNAFTCEEERVIAEELWQMKLLSFYGEFLN